MYVFLQSNDTKRFQISVRLVCVCFLFVFWFVIFNFTNELSKLKYQNKLGISYILNNQELYEVLNWIPIAEAWLLFFVDLWTKCWENNHFSVFLVVFCNKVLRVQVKESSVAPTFCCIILHRVHQKKQRCTISVKF